MKNKKPGKWKAAFSVGMAFFATCSAFAGSGTHGGQSVDVNGRPALRDLVDRTVCDWVQPGKFEKPAYWGTAMAALKDTHWLLAARIESEFGKLAVCKTTSLINLNERDFQDLTIFKGKTKQIAIRVNDSIYLDMDLYDQLSLRDQAYLFIHEAMHSYLPGSLSQRASKLRSLIKVLSDNELQRMDPEKFDYALRRNDVLIYNSKTNIQSEGQWLGRYSLSLVELDQAMPILRHLVEKTPYTQEEMLFSVENLETIFPNRGFSYPVVYDDETHVLSGELRELNRLMSGYFDREINLPLRKALAEKNEGLLGAVSRTIIQGTQSRYSHLKGAQGWLLNQYSLVELSFGFFDSDAKLSDFMGFSISALRAFFSDELVKLRIGIRWRFFVERAVETQNQELLDLFVDDRVKSEGEELCKVPLMNALSEDRPYYDARGPSFGKSPKSRFALKNLLSKTRWLEEVVLRGYLDQAKRSPHESGLGMWLFRDEDDEDFDVNKMIFEKLTLDQKKMLFSAKFEGDYWFVKGRQYTSGWFLSRSKHSVASRNILGAVSSPRVLRYLLEQPEANPNERFSLDTPLIFHASNCSYEMLQILLKSPKVDRSLKNMYGHTAEDIARFQCSDDVVKLFEQN